jgi:hypothetical protein
MNDKRDSTLKDNIATFYLTRFGSCSLVGLFANHYFINTKPKEAMNEFKNKFDSKITLVLIIESFKPGNIIPSHLVSRLQCVCDDVAYFKKEFDITVDIEFVFALEKREMFITNASKEAVARGKEHAYRPSKNVVIPKP